MRAAYPLIRPTQPTPDVHAKETRDISLRTHPHHTLHKSRMAENAVFKNIHGDQHRTYGTSHPAHLNSARR
jgi:hypothetical protein